MSLKYNFDVDYIYQLNVKKTRDKFFYIKATKQGNFLEIYKTFDQGVKKFLSVSLDFSPISTGWMENEIFLQSETGLYIFNLEIEKLINMPSASYKILFMDKWKETYVYGTLLDFDFIEFYEYEYKQKDKKIGIYFLEDQRLETEDNNMFFNKYPFIEKYINNYKKMQENKINDFWNEKFLKIENSKLYTSLYINTEKVIQKYGHMDRAFLLDNGYVYTLSSLDKEQNIYFHLSNKQDGLDIVETKNNKLNVEYFEKGSLDIPYYIVHSYLKCRGNVIMIHGGPCSHYSNQYDPLVKSLAEIGLKVYLINYTGSTGYGEEFKKKLYGRGGTYDFSDIKRCIKRISEYDSNSPLFVIGDSYGGYLALLCLLKTHNKVDKFYVTNTFTDLRYQYLFSKSNYIIKKYFPNVVTDEILKYNPIDLVKGVCDLKQLLIVNGVNDPYCPFQQICQFKKKTNCDVKFIRDYPHFKVGYSDQWKLYRYIIEDLRGIVNEKS